MAKSFKQLSTDAVQPAKRTSEKDILDFLEQDWLAPTSPTELALTSTSSPTTATKSTEPDKVTYSENTSNNANTNNIYNTGNISNSNVTDVENPQQQSVPSNSAKESVRPIKQPKRKIPQSFTEQVSPDKVQLNRVDITNAPVVTSVTGITKVNKNESLQGGTPIHDVDHEAREYDVDVRQTFVLGQRYLERLKNFVHTKRMIGEYDFTQKQALHQALDLLFATARIEERPLQIRQKEEIRRQQIRKGKLK